MGAAMSCGPNKRSLRPALVAIADNADDFGFACPSIATIAAKVCCDERTAMRLVQELERTGWVKVCRRVLNGKGSVYFIDIAKLGVVENARMRRSQLHVDIAKLLQEREAEKLQKSGDKMSPEKEPAKAESGDNPQGSQVTKTPDSGDKTLFPILKNHKEPSLEPIQPPTPLRGDAQDELEPPDPDGKQRGIWELVNRTRAREGRAAIGWAAWVQQQIAGGSWPDAGTPDAAPDQEFARCADCNEAAELVMRRCGLLEMRLLPVIAGALLSEMQRTGVAAGAVGERACVSFLAYRAQAGSLRYAWGPKRFFSEGYWLDPRSWPADRDSARSREALVGTYQG
jgi:hypothetical protein